MHFWSVWGRDQSITLSHARIGGSPLACTVLAHARCARSTPTTPSPQLTLLGLSPLCAPPLCALRNGQQGSQYVWGPRDAGVNPRLGGPRGLASTPRRGGAARTTSLTQGMSMWGWGLCAISFEWCARRLGRTWDASGGAPLECPPSRPVGRAAPPVLGAGGIDLSRLSTSSIAASTGSPDMTAAENFFAPLTRTVRLVTFPKPFGEQYA